MRALAAFALAVTLVLCGCGGNNNIMRSDEQEESATRQVSGRFMSNRYDDKFETVVDTRTGVTYLVWVRSSGDARVGGITPLLNRNGTPVISEEGE